VNTPKSPEGQLKPESLKEYCQRERCLRKHGYLCERVPDIAHRDEENALLHKLECIKSCFNFHLENDVYQQT